MSVQSAFDLKNVLVKREATWQEAVVEYKSIITLANSGNDPAESFLFLLPSNIADRVGYLTASLGSKQLRVEELGSLENSKGWIIKFINPLAAQKQQTVTVSAIITHPFQALPAEGLLMESNGAISELPYRHLSPYPTLADSLTVSGFSQLLAYAPNLDVTVSEGSIKWEVSDSSSATQATVQAKYSHPLPHFQSVTREISVSHWGMISVTDSFDLRNNAQKLSGEFSRVPFSIADQLRGNAPFTIDGSLTSLKAVLPRYTRNVAYFDVIGNISTSRAARVGKSHVGVDIQPRFPVLGGWKTEYSLSYDLPAKFVLADEGLMDGQNSLLSWLFEPTRFSLSIPANYPFVKVPADKVKFLIELPEGARDISVQLPGGRSVDQIVTETKRGWLSTPLIGGNTLVSFEIDGPFFIPEREALNFKLKVKYSYAKLGNIRQGLLLVGYVFALFLLAILSGRLFGYESMGGIRSGATTAKGSPVGSGPSSPTSVHPPVTEIRAKLASLAPREGVKKRK